nr:hypothetical protein [Thiomicrorhabdus sp.]
QSLRDRLMDSEISLELDKAVLDLLGEAGFDPVFGARPLKRVIQQRVENPLAQKILRGEYPAGSTIHVTLKGEEIQFN